MSSDLLLFFLVFLLCSSTQRLYGLVQLLGDQGRLCVGLIRFIFGLDPVLSFLELATHHYGQYVQELRHLSRAVSLLSAILYHAELLAFALLSHAALLAFVLLSHEALSAFAKVPHASMVSLVRLLHTSIL